MLPLVGTTTFEKPPGGMTTDPLPVDTTVIVTLPVIAFTIVASYPQGGNTTVVETLPVNMSMLQAA